MVQCWKENSWDDVGILNFGHRVGNGARASTREDRGSPRPVSRLITPTTTESLPGSRVFHEPPGFTVAESGGTGSYSDFERGPHRQDWSEKSTPREAGGDIFLLFVFYVND